ncbi:type VII secretion target [Mycobacterium kansasii]
MAVNQLQASPTQLRQWATAHDGAAEACAAARAEHVRTVQSAVSWGPLFHEAIRAAVDAVNARENALLVEEQRHRAMANQLRSSADQFEQMNAANRASLTISTD